MTRNSHISFTQTDDASFYVVDKEEVLEQLKTAKLVISSIRSYLKDIY